MIKINHKIFNKSLNCIFAAALILVLLPVSGFTQEEQGKQLYDDWCAGCHGYEGSGKGYAMEFTYPKPRDFASGTFKFSSTTSGDPPTDEDIKRIIIEGNPGTSMPGWQHFSDDELDALVEYIKGFAEEDFEIPGERFEIAEAPEVTDKIIEEGRKSFEKRKCFECHGGYARGSGEKGQQIQKDDWGYRIFPADLTHPWELKNGPEVEDLFRSITAGIEGTPMASYEFSMSEDERWAVSYYLKSIQFKRKLGSVVKATKVEDIPSSTDDGLWDTTDYIDLPLAGQLMFKTRHFTPTMTNVRARGLFTDSELAIMLEWTDKKPNKGDDGHPPDAVRLQFPIELSSGPEKPFFYMGNKNNPVKLWYWSASDDIAVEFIARGHEEDKISRQEQVDVKAFSDYNDGLYKVIFKRRLDTKKENDITFAPGKFIPFSVTVFDGERDETGNRAEISSWYYFMMEPPTPLKVYLMPPVAAFAFIGIAISIRRKLKKQSGNVGGNQDV